MPVPEWLSNNGIRVEILTEDIAVANDLDPTNRNALYQRYFIRPPLVLTFFFSFAAQLSEYLD